MAGEHATSARQRFQFSLTSLFLLTTLVALWLAWELAFIRQRQAWLRENGAIVDPQPGSVLIEVVPPSAPSIPWWRRTLGDEAVTTIIAQDRWTDDERTVVARLFPEATVAPALDLAVFKMPGIEGTVDEPAADQPITETVRNERS